MTDTMTWITAATLDDIDVLITDEGISEHQLKALKKAGVDVVIV